MEVNLSISRSPTDPMVQGCSAGCARPGLQLVPNSALYCTSAGPQLCTVLYFSLLSAGFRFSMHQRPRPVESISPNVRLCLCVYLSSTLAKFWKCVDVRLLGKERIPKFAQVRSFLGFGKSFWVLRFIGVFTLFVPLPAFLEWFLSGDNEVTPPSSPPPPRPRPLWDLFGIGATISARQEA